MTQKDGVWSRSAHSLQSDARGKMNPFSRHKLQLKTCELANLITLDRKGAIFPSITCRERRENRRNRAVNNNNNNNNKAYKHSSSNTSTGSQ
ncbi:hypothetical protein EYF80_026121 [Liparis tanakae]|uniref:Uncharacterized protein n=1 Tax=Liparis tanakae TaxID=230148 RepID=A0A4Z2HFE4_9TELE|nr:hypothetical protein EYF80_026121 [Liparis tanakae]